MAHIVREPIKKVTENGDLYWQVEVYQAYDKTCVHVKIFDTEEEALDWIHLVKWQMQEGFQW